MRKILEKNSKENVCINTNGKYADSKYNGFTLIELLAIIVILAVIAVITVPIILNIIDNSKKGAITDSAYGYKDALQKYNMTLLTRNPESEGLKGSYTVTELKNLGLEISGQEPSEGIILIDNEGITGCLKFDEYTTYLYNNQVVGTAKGNCPTQKLVTTGDGLYKSTTEPGRLIYRGANPNNRIFLSEDGTNNTLYRIVSYETDGTIKVVRDEKLFNKAWDEANVRKSDGTNNTYCTSENGCNVWGDQTNTLYNGSSLGDSFHYFYYSSPTATTLSNGGAGKVGTESTLNKYLNDGSWTGLSNLESYIDNHSWNVGGVYYTADDKGIIKEKEEESVLTWNGKVGLMNITEYVEASLNPTCTSARSNYSSSSGSPCKESNWTYKNYHQWSLSPVSNTRVGVWLVISAGYFSYYGGAHGTFGVRPAFYLKSNIGLTGSGTETNPYRILG